MRIESNDRPTPWRPPPGAALASEPKSPSPAQSPATASASAPSSTSGLDGRRQTAAPRRAGPADFADGGFATLSNGSRIPFGKGAISKNGDNFVPATAGKPARTIPASSISRLESRAVGDHRQRPPQAVVSGTPSASGASSSGASTGGGIRNRRQAARARVADAKAELRRLNSRKASKHARAAARRRLTEAQTELRRLNSGLGRSTVNSATTPSTIKTPASAPSVAAAAKEESADHTPATSQATVGAIAAVTGRVVGSRYKRIDQLTRRLDGWKIDVYSDADDILDLRGALEGRQLGALFTGRPDGTGRLLLRSDATRYEVLHELSHVLDFRFNPREWIHAARNNELSKVMREQAVFNRLRNGRKWWMLSFQEQLHAYRLIERVGGNPKIFLGSGRTMSQFRFGPPNPRASRP